MYIAVSNSIKASSIVLWSVHIYLTQRTLLATIEFFKQNIAFDLLSFLKVYMIDFFLFAISILSDMQILT